MNFWTWVVIILVAAVALWYIFIEYPATSSPQSSATSTVQATEPTIIPGVTSELYSNTQYGFSIWYPSDTTVSTSSYQGYLAITETPVVSFALPSSMFSGTNLVEASVVVGATTTSSIVSECDTAAQGEIASGTETLSGEPFSIFDGTGAGVGQIYETKALRDEHDGTCYEIVELLHSGQLGNYPTGAVAQFNMQQFESILDSIAGTFSFSNP